MATKLGKIAMKAKQERKCRFTSLAHHVTKELVWESLKKINRNTTPGVDGISAKEAEETFHTWVEPMLESMHQRGYKPPAIKRCWVPRPGKQAKRPIGIPCIGDRALQRSVSTVISQIYEQDFLSCSFGGRPNRGAHQALATLNEIIAGKKVSWVYEADLKNYFGSLNHNWLIKFVEHRIGDPRIISLIRRWLRAGVLEEGSITIPKQGTPQGGNISVILSNIYLHYVLDLWFEKTVKPRLKGEAYLLRYIDDFVVCFQYREDALRFQGALANRLAKFSLELELSKTQLIEFGRFAQKQATRRKKKVETLYFLGFTHYCTKSRKGNFMIGRKTEKTRFRKGLLKLKKLMWKVMHDPIKEQIKGINRFLKGHYNYYGMGGNFRALSRVYRSAEKMWRKTLSRRSREKKMTWEKYGRIKETYPILKPRIKLPYGEFKSMVIL